MSPEWTEELSAKTEVHKIADAVRSSVQDHIGHTVDIYVAKTYREQDQSRILGKFYLIKVDIGDANCFVHMEVFVPRKYPGSQPVLLSVVENIRMSDPLDPLV